MKHFEQACVMERKAWWRGKHGGERRRGELSWRCDEGLVHLAYNPSYLACFFSQNNIFLS
jgi:hypothetical protein